jgi:cyclopropane fatty-acyl-phospholipid synthase-like methyltransferase
VGSDQESLAMAEELAGRHGLSDRFDGSVVDLLDLDTLHDTPARFDMADILGFFEYLPSETGTGFPSASDYIAAAVSVVEPGGVLVLANMLDTHPQLDFVMRCVQWPFIQPRSVDELVGLIQAAGVADDRTTIYLPDDGVYAVAAIQV